MARAFTPEELERLSKMKPGCSHDIDGPNDCAELATHIEYGTPFCDRHGYHVWGCKDCDGTGVCRECKGRGLVRYGHPVNVEMACKACGDSSLTFVAGSGRCHSCQQKREETPDGKP